MIHGLKMFHSVQYGQEIKSVIQVQRWLRIGNLMCGCMPQWGCMSIAVAFLHSPPLSATKLQEFERGGYTQTNLPFRNPPESLQHPLTDVLQRERSCCDGEQAAALWAAASGISDR